MAFLIRIVVRPLSLLSLSCVALSACDQWSDKVCTVETGSEQYVGNGQSETRHGPKEKFYSVEKAARYSESSYRKADEGWEARKKAYDEEWKALTKRNTAPSTAQLEEAQKSLAANKAALEEAKQDAQKVEKALKEQGNPQPLNNIPTGDAKANVVLTLDTGPTESTSTTTNSPAKDKRVEALEQVQKAAKAKVTELEGKVKADQEKVTSLEAEQKQAAATFENLEPPRQPMRPVVGRPECRYKNFGELVKDQNIFLPITGIFNILDRTVGPGIPEEYKQKSALMRTLERGLATLFWNVEVAQAATGKKGKEEVVLRPSEILKRFAPARGDIKKSLGVLDEVRFVPGKEAGSTRVILRSKLGQKIEFRADRDWEKACNLLDESLDRSDKASMEVMNSKTGKTMLRAHPFEGKTCSRSRLERFRFVNLFEVHDPIDAKTPALTVLVGTTEYPGVYTFARYDSKTWVESRLSAQLREFFDPARYPSARRFKSTQR